MLPGIYLCEFVPEVTHFGSLFQHNMMPKPPLKVPSFYRGGLILISLKQKNYLPITAEIIILNLNT